MCTLRITINDAVMQKVKGLFASEADLTAFVQQQLETALEKVAENSAKEGRRAIEVSDRIKALSNVPPTYGDVDYKDSVVAELSEKYSQ